MHGSCVGVALPGTPHPTRRGAVVATPHRHFPLDRKRNTAWGCFSPRVRGMRSGQVRFLLRYARNHTTPAESPKHTRGQVRGHGPRTPVVQTHGRPRSEAGWGAAAMTDGPPVLSPSPPLLKYLTPLKKALEQRFAHSVFVRRGRPRGVAARTSGKARCARSLVHGPFERS